VIKPYFNALSTVLPKLEESINNCVLNSAKFGELKEKYASELE